MEAEIQKREALSPMLKCFVHGDGNVWKHILGLWAVQSIEVLLQKMSKNPLEEWAQESLRDCSIGVSMWDRKERQWLLSSQKFEKYSNSEGNNEEIE